MGSISHHITPLVTITSGGDTHKHTHTHSQTEANIGNQVSVLKVGMVDVDIHVSSLVWPPFGGVYKGMPGCIELFKRKAGLGCR